ncbi:thioredoxin domain-containing protein 11 isoform X2 [Genypterus blacodes]|uniref:thioredoxin domain-containing protein 11 isoform X2 n=1 Tax=Genypterus blacodes TaxID=154954 RepID=UPI003F76CF9A
MLRRVRHSLRQVLCLMARRPALVCGAIVLGLLLILAVKFTYSAKNVVAAARPPVRFFSADAPVVDLYLGQLDQVERLRSVAEVSFIFFYAPWCAHSMAARQEVQQVAQQLAKQVQFVAVNCWWSQGKCRRQNRFYQYPIIHLFYRRFGPIEYKGPLVAAYLESFVLRAITPLTYLSSRATLQQFISHHEPRVVGFFQFNSSPQPPGYITYLLSALQALKRDFRGVVRFGVVTNRRVAEVISVKEDETVYLHRQFNTSLIFPRTKRNFTSRAVCSWVFEHYETVLKWLQPTGTKSRLLEKELSQGPALLIFLPYNPLGSGTNPALQQIEDIAVRYHSCDSTRRSGSDRTDASTSHPVCCQSVILPESNVASSRTVCELCLSLWRPSLSGSATRCSFPSTSQGADVWHSNLKKCCIHQLPAHVPMSTEASSVCSNFLGSYSPFGQYSACCRTVQPQLNDTSSQAKEGSDFPKVPLNPPFSSNDSSSDPHRAADGITGLLCQTNRTLRFYLLDVALNQLLAARLGAPSNESASQYREADQSADGLFATIVNLKDEVHYVLHHSSAITLTESLEAFIRNFSAPYSLLQRHLVGEEDRRGHEEEAQRPGQHQRSPQRPLIAELTTSSFLASIMDLQKDVVLFYYTQWCGFCSVLNHIIIQLARLLQGNSTITVARVNVARNDLPWEFMVDHVPSILIFPRYRKHLSVKYPEDLPITLPNLLRFILQHSDAAQPSVEPLEASAEAGGPGAYAVIREEFLALQHEVQALHQARERLSQQLAQLWRDNQRLTFDARILEAQNAELQQERQSLEEQHREKSRQLGKAVRRLQELVDASESLLNENTLLGILLKELKDRTEVKEQAEVDGEEAEQERHHMAS